MKIKCGYKLGDCRAELGVRSGALTDMSIIYAVPVLDNQKKVIE